jgi:hypothetical protein
MQLFGLARFVSYFYDLLLYLNMFTGMEAPGISAALWLDAVIVGFILYAGYYLLAKTAREKKWFLLLLIFPAFLFFYLTDIYRHSFTSILWRYHIVNMVIVGLVITNLLQDKMGNGRLLFGAIYLGLVTLGLLSIFKISETRCWNTSPDCGSNIEEAQFISHAERPLLITDFNKFGLVNFLAVINEAKLSNADVMYCKGEVPDIYAKAKANAYSDIYVIHASDSLASAVQAQFGKSMLPFRKEVPPFSSQIWHVRLK